MIFELPEFTRCCFCAPLRGGLLVWGYIKLVFSALAIALFISLKGNSSITSWCFLIIDIGFTLCFLYGVHQQDPKCLRYFYIYTIVSLVLGSLTEIIGLGFIIYVIVEYASGNVAAVVVLAQTVIIAFLSLLVAIFVQFYTILLIRSELNRITTIRQPEFVNINYQRTVGAINQTAP